MPTVTVGAPKVVWKDPKTLYTFEDGSTIAYLDTHEDLATLGEKMGHCSGTHFVWAIEEKLWYFFVLLDKDGNPHATIHAKHTSWLNKTHPRDNYPLSPVNGEEIYRLNGYMYPSFTKVCAEFKARGLEYEPGKYRALMYNSTTYDHGIERGEQQFSFEGKYYCPLPNNGNRPNDVDTDIWAAYVKAHKAMCDNFRKNTGAVQLCGRRVKFDGKYITILSASTRGQTEVEGDYRKKINEWLIDLGRKGA